MLWLSLELCVAWDLAFHDHLALVDSDTLLDHRSDTSYSIALTKEWVYSTVANSSLMRMYVVHTSSRILISSVVDDVLVGFEIPLRSKQVACETNQLGEMARPEGHRGDRSAKSDLLSALSQKWVTDEDNFGRQKPTLMLMASRHPRISPTQNLRRASVSS